MMFVPSFALILLLAVSMVKSDALMEEENRGMDEENWSMEEANWGMEEEEEEGPDADVQRLSFSTNFFGIHLHKKLSRKMGGNVFFSPFAVSSALTMLYRGAQNGTAKELKTVLGYHVIADQTVFSAFKHYLTNVLGKTHPEAYTVNFISALVVDSSFPLSPLYKHQMQDVFQAYVQEANLKKENAAVVNKLNMWANIKTRGTIDSLADRIDPGASLFLASAAYFKGAWKVKFNPEETKHQVFYNKGLESKAKKIPMMHCYASVRYFEDEDVDFTAVELLYEGRDLSMVIYLPNRRDGLRDLVRKMKPSSFALVRRQMYYQKVHVTMPKFKLEMDQSLLAPLKKLGLLKIFHFGANLSGMAPEGVSLVLDDVRHKALIEVNEKGSIAAAMTRVVMTKSMPLPIPDPEFNVNRPFMFAIYDHRSNMILFMGSVNEL